VLGVLTLEIDPRWGQGAARRWAAAAFLLALTASLVLLLAPLGTEVESTAESPGFSGAPARQEEPETRVTHPSLLQHEGWRVVVPLSVPVLVSGVGAVAAARRSRRLLILAAVLLGAFVIVGVLSIGIFFVPSEAAMIVAAVKGRRT